MLQNPPKLQSLIDEYKRLRELHDFTPQSRGQRFNSFIAELLQCWGIDATPNLHGSGEIDVAFELNGKHFNLEAKWEKEPVNTDPIAKLQKRLRQRLMGTIGLFVSMSGFTPHAIKDLKEGEQLSVLLLAREHFDAMLSGFIPPDELIGQIVKRASIYGEGFVPIQNLFEPVPAAQLGIKFDTPIEFLDKELVLEAVPGFTADIVASDIPYGQHGVAELSTNKVLLTLTHGIYQLDYKTRMLSPFLGIPNCSRNALVTKDGTVFVVRKSGVACVKDGNINFVGGGFIGSSCLFLGEAGDLWIYSCGLLNLSEFSVQIARLSHQVGDEVRYKFNRPLACGSNATQLSNGTFLIVGSHGVVVTEIEGEIELLTKDLNNPMGLARLSSAKFLLASDDVELSELDMLNRSLKRISKLRLRGSVYELAKSSHGGGFLFTHYPKQSGEMAGILIRWNY